MEEFTYFLYLCGETALSIYERYFATSARGIWCSVLLNCLNE